MHGYWGFFRRFSADVLFFFTALLCSPIGSLRYQEAGRDNANQFLKWVGIPLCTIVFILLCMMQVLPTDRMNFSRFIIEHPVCQFLGYCSYTMYLFQHIAFEFYGQLIYQHVNSSPGQPDYSYPTTGQEYHDRLVEQWFRTVPEGYQTLAVLVLLVFCYLVQKFFQDTLIMGLVSKYLL